MPITLPQAITLGGIYEDLIDDAEDLVGAASRIAPAAAREVLCSIGGALSLGAGPGGIFTKLSPAAKAQSDLGGILQAACPVPPPVPVPPSPPFVGGQCPDVIYILTGLSDVRRSSGDPDGTRDLIGSGSFSVTGPVGGFVYENPNDWGFRTIKLQTGLGPVTVRSTSFNTRGYDEAEFTGIIREDGLPDDCGDPPAPPPPPRSPIVQPPRSPDIPRIDPDGNPLPPIYFEPRVGPIYIGPQGDLNIPVTINIGGPSLNIPISIPVSVGLPSFEPSFHFGGNGGGTGPGQPAEPGPPQGICCPPPPRFTEKGEEEDPEEPPEEQPEDGIIVGINVVTAAASGTAKATVLGTASPPLRIPRIGTVQFGTGSEDEEFIGPDIQIKQLRQYVVAPTDVPVTRAFVRWESGWDGEFDYVYAPRNPQPAE